MLIPCSLLLTTLIQLGPAPTAQSPPAPAPMLYSDAYRRRARVHRTASVAMLPLFAVEGALGRSLFNNPTPTRLAAHRAIGWSIGGLFAANSVTGVWNLMEARHDTTGRTRRRWHGALMLAADAGFLTTAMLAPDADGHGSRVAHRAMALGAISTAAVGYLVMLLGGH